MMKQSGQSARFEPLIKHYDEFPAAKAEMATQIENFLDQVCQIKAQCCSAYIPYITSPMLGDLSKMASECLFDFEKIFVSKQLTSNKYDAIIKVIEKDPSLSKIKTKIIDYSTRLDNASVEYNPLREALIQLNKAIDIFQEKQKPQKASAVEPEAMDAIIATSSADTDTTIRNQNDEITRLRTEQSRHISQIASLQRENSALTSTVSQLEEALNHFQQQHQHLLSAQHQVMQSAIHAGMTFAFDADNQHDGYKKSDNALSVKSSHSSEEQLTTTIEEEGVVINGIY